MRAYAYVAYTQNGRKRRGTLVAENEARATEQLQAQGLFAEELREKSGAAKTPGLRLGRGRGRASEETLAVFTRQLAVLLNAELPVETALETVRDAGGTAQVEAMAAAAQAALLDGHSLADALGKSGMTFPPYFLTTIGAGEKSGELGAVFEALADHLEETGANKAAVVTALIYPAFVALVAFGVGGVLLINVAPEIAEMFESAGRPLPPLTQVTMGISGFIQSNWLFLLGLVLGVVALASLALRRPAIRDRWDEFVLRLPYVGRLVRLSAAAQYLRALSLVISSRHGVVEACESAADVLSISRYRRQAQSLTDAIRSGEGLSEGLMRFDLIPPVCCQLIRAGEQSARLARMTERSAFLVENWVVNDRKRLVSIIDPLLMVTVGAVVLVIVLSVLLPIFDLQSVVSGP